MAVLSKEAFLERINQLFPESEDNEERDLSQIEDFVDTYNDLENRTVNDEWKAKYEDLRRKYRERFFNGEITEPEKQEEEKQEEEKQDTEEMTEEEIIDFYMPKRED